MRNQKSLHLKSYFGIASSLLTSNDLYYLPYAIKIIPIELGIRFLEDFLNGNSNFNIEYESQNLDRAEVQFKFAKEVDIHWTSILDVINRLKRFN